MMIKKGVVMLVWCDDDYYGDGNGNGNRRDVNYVNDDVIMHF